MQRSPRAVPLRALIRALRSRLCRSHLRLCHIAFGALQRQRTEPAAVWAIGWLHLRGRVAGDERNQGTKTPLHAALSIGTESMIAARPLAPNSSVTTGSGRTESGEYSQIHHGELGSGWPEPRVRLQAVWQQDIVPDTCDMTGFTRSAHESFGRARAPWIRCTQFPSPPRCYAPVHVSQCRDWRT